MALANRLAGSIVTTTDRRPRRAPSIAMAAAVVVLPTPPVPVHTMIAASCASAARVIGRSSVGGFQRPYGAEQVLAQHVELGGTEVGFEEEREVQLRQRELFGETTDL